MEKRKAEIEENLKFGLLDILILKLISKEDMYGYQIKQQINIQSNGLIEIKEGSLYGPLYRLEKKGMITPIKVLVGNKRFRIYYHLTQDGFNFLNDAIEIFNHFYAGANKILNTIGE